MDREIRVPEPLWEDLPGFARHSAMLFRHVPIGLGGLFVDMDQPFAVGLETSPFILTRKEMGVFAELREHKLTMIAARKPLPSGAGRKSGFPPL
jgi:hypothetical protein